MSLIYPTPADLQKFLTATGLIDVPTSATQSLYDFDLYINAAKEQWEIKTGYRPFLATTQTRTYDPPGPERGPVGIYVGINNMGGGRKLFFDEGLLSVTSVYVGSNHRSLSVTGTLSGTVTSGTFTGTFTGSLSTPGTYIGTGTGTIAGSGGGTGTGTLTVTTNGTTSGTFSVTGTVTGNASGTVTGTCTLSGVVTTTGQLLTNTVDYWLRPENASYGNFPYTYIEFGYPQWGNPQSLVITGSFGRYSTLPYNAFQAILKMAALEMLPSLMLLKTQGTTSIEQENVKYTYSSGGKGAYSALEEMWQKQVSRELFNYQRKRAI